MKSLIHGFFNQFRRFMLYRKLVLSFMTLLAVFTVLIITLLYTLFTHVMHQEYKYMTQNSLVSADSVLQNSYDKMADVINEVLSLPSISAFFLGDQADRVNEAYIFSELRRLKNLYPDIGKISLVNLSVGRYLGTDGASDSVDETIVELYEERRDGGGIVSLRRTVPENIRLTNSPSAEVSTFVFFPAGQYGNSAIILDLKDDYFIKLLNPAVVHPRDQIFLITNESVFIGRDMNPAVEWLSLPEALDEDDFKIIDIADTRCAVTARDACIPGWKLVRVMPMVGSGILTRQLSLQLSLMLLVFLAAVLYGVYKMIRRIYSPVRAMVKEQVDSPDTDTVDEIGLIYNELIKRSGEIQRLTKRLNRSRTIFNGSWVKSQLLGDLENAKKAETLAREQGILPPADTWRCAAVLAVDHDQLYNSTLDVGERGLHDFAASNIFTELMGEYIVGGLIRMDEQKLACIIACPDGFLTEQMLDAMKRFQKNFYTYFEQTVSIGLGLPVAAQEDTVKSYGQACTALKYRFYRGQGSLSVYEKAPDNWRTGYPVREERQILEAILVRDAKALEKAQTAFLQAVGTQEETRVKGFTERCLNSLLTGLAIRSVVVPHDDIYKEVYGCETMEELEQLFKRWGGVMLLTCGETFKKDKQGEKNPVLFARNYIEEHYFEVDLSVEYLAGLVDLTPAYFGKQFYNTLHLSCNDYIADVRLENAARLLRETAMTVQEISERVGVGSINYFYRLFKKKYGETPVSYRKKESNNAAKQQNHKKENSSDESE